MRPAAWVLAMCGALAFGACASNGAPEGQGDGSRASAGGTSGECVTGRVGTGGTFVEPMVVIRPDGTAAVPVQGGRTEQVRLLSGTVVRVCGARTATGRIEPAEVDLLEVDGMPAHLGVLRRAGERWEVVRERDGEVVRLASVPERLTEAEGGVVWVAGAGSMDAFEVRAYGVLEGW